jgi:hypothetical protein
MIPICNFSKEVVTMRMRLKRFLFMTLCTAGLLGILCAGANAYTYPTMPSDWQSVKVTIGDVTLPLAEYPSGSYFSSEKDTMTVAQQQQYGITAGKDIWLRGWQCVGFARYVYTAAFYKYPQNATIDNHLAYDYASSVYYRNMIEEVLGTKTLSAGYSASTLKTLFTACQPGAVFRVTGHSMVLMAIYDDGFLVYDANFSDSNQVSVRKYTWQSFVDSFGARDITALQMPKYYPGYSYSTGGSSTSSTTTYTLDTSTAGTYRVYNCSTLNVRSGPGTSFERVTEIASGVIVEALGSYGNWYAISYNGTQRWVYGDYLTPYQGELTVSFDADGGAASFSTGTYQKGVRFGNLPTATKTDRELVGWYDGDALYSSDSTVPDVDGLALKAKWCVLGFRDVLETSWYASYVERAAKAGLISATSSFNPEANTKRCDFVAVLSREYQRETGNTISGDGSSVFTDVASSDYYNVAVGWAYSTGVVKGVSETQFSPYGEVTREQIATYLYRFVRYVGIDSEYYGQSLIYDFVDGASVSNYAVDAMNWAVSVGLFQGDENGNLNPQGYAKRCEMVTIMDRFMDYIG